MKRIPVILLLAVAVLAGCSNETQEAVQRADAARTQSVQDARNEAWIQNIRDEAAIKHAKARVAIEKFNAQADKATQAHEKFENSEEIRVSKGEGQDARLITVDDATNAPVDNGASSSQLQCTGDKAPTEAMRLGGNNGAVDTIWVCTP